MDDLPRLVRELKPDEVLIAIPSASGETRRLVVEAAQASNVPVKTLPGLYELIAGDLNLAGQIRPVQVEDVLGREQVEVDFEAVAAYLKGHTVLITGAGGSIGSELCRQIARVGPARLILVDNAETPLFEIERELVDERDFTAAVPKLVDVKDAKAMRREVFEKYAPTIVFHAAAYKHVPLMNTHPLASVRNNVVATKVVAELAAEFEVERFVLISTDKAVNPQTVMGQSKAICEWIVEALGHRRDVATRFTGVRFGNVLNSSGSVIPTFRKQIAKGGPVTVTHPEMTRFFMTIPEAVSLVVQAGAIGGRGQIFVLDMGEPVKIVDLACNMIRLSGKEPRLPNDPEIGPRDIAVQFVGSRPGEKLHEVLWDADEAVGDTVHPKIMRLSRPPIDEAWLHDQLQELVAAGGRGRHARGRREARLDRPRAEARGGADAGAVRRQRAAAGAAASRNQAAGKASRSRPALPVRCSGGRRADSRRAQRGAARCRGGDARTGLHPRRRRHREDDDDHAPHRVAGRERRVRAVGDRRGDVHRQGGGRAAGAARRARRRGRACLDLPLGGARAAAPLPGRSRAGSSPRRRCCCGASATGSRSRSASGPRATSRRRSSGRRTGGSRRRRTCAGWATTSRRSRPISPSVSSASTRSARPRRVRSTSRTCSGSRSVALEDDEQALETVRARWQAFTVDEYQDVNLLQQTLLDLWLGARDDLCVVGDDYQSIYSFTGASARWLLALPQRFPQAHVVRLEQNYRSTPQVLALANRLVPKLGGSEKTLRPTLADGPEPELCRCSTPEEQAMLVTERARALSKAGVPFEDQAVLVRTNARAADFEEAFHDAGIPFQGASLLARDAARRLIKTLGHGGATDVAATVRATRAGAGAAREPAREARRARADAAGRPRAPRPARRAVRRRRAHRRGVRREPAGALRRERRPRRASADAASCEGARVRRGVPARGSRRASCRRVAHGARSSPTSGGCSTSG